MQAAQLLAGYSLGEADLLRRAMGKKIQSEMDAQRARFVEGCATHNQIPAAKANELFDTIDKFAGYGFNKSHAAGYALIAYQTAWLKAHHRAEFYAASMSFDMALTDKLGVFVEDMRRGGVECLPPDINASQAHFTVEDGAVRYALGALKGVGEKAMEALVEEREQGGPFASLEDFAARIDPRLLNRRQLESLAGAGAFDGLNPNRAAVFDGAETILAHAASAYEQKTSGQAGLFGAGLGGNGADPASARRVMDSRPAHGRRARGLRFLFLGPSGRCRAAPACSAQGQDVRRARGHPHRRGRAGQRDDGGAGRGRRAGGPRPRDGATWSRRCQDRSGQFEATVFDDEPSSALEAAAKAGACGLLTVELDRRAGDDSPRVTIKRFQPLDALAKRTRLQMIVRLADASLASSARRATGRCARRQRPRALHRAARDPAARRWSLRAATSRSTRNSPRASNA